MTLDLRARFQWTRLGLLDRALLQIFLRNSPQQPIGGEVRLHRKGNYTQEVTYATLQKRKGSPYPLTIQRIW